MYENRRVGLLFALPFVLGVLGFKLFPFVVSLARSFTQYDGFTPPRYLGIDNEASLALDDPTFRG